MSSYNPYFFLIGAALLLSAMGLWFTLIVPGIDRWSRRFFRIYFLIFLLFRMRNPRLRKKRFP